MKSKSDKYESIDDIKPPIHPDFLSYLQIVAGIAGLILVACLLFIPVNPWSKAIVMVILMVLALVLIAHGLATYNDGVKAKRTINFMQDNYSDSYTYTTQELVTADYETLEARGRELLDREKEVEEEQE